MAQPESLAADDARLLDVLDLIHTAFTKMDGRIDPPSSVHSFDAGTLARHASAGELVVIGTPPVAAMIMQTKTSTLYLGKLAVADANRRTGLARALVVFAAKTARQRGLNTLTLQTRVELTENHATFRDLGFVETARTAHAGFDKPTSITFTMTV